MRHDLDDGWVVRLKAYRLTVRKPRLQARGGELVLRLPGYFGRNAWRVPIGEVGDADLTSPALVAEDSEDLYPDGIVIPYLFTTGPLTRPTTLLLFGQPQRVPPLRLLLAWYGDLPFGYWSSRSQAGASVDGVLLRAREPAEAAARAWSPLALNGWMTRRRGCGRTVGWRPTRPSGQRFLRVSLDPRGCIGRRKRRSSWC